MNAQQADLTIAIDGPAGSGKSTLGKLLAQRLGYLYFDSGVMYRAVTCVALARGLDLTDESAINRLAGELAIELRPASLEDGRDHDLIADGEDITWEIRSPKVDANVSAVSAYPGVRRALTARLREFGARGRIVMVGRDIGTVVLPGADLKIYLEASAEERARRRFAERRARGESADYQEILESIQNRDRIDSSRETAPLRASQDAITIKSDDLSIDQVVDAAFDLVDAVQAVGG